MRNIIEIIVAILEVFCVIFSAFLLFYAYFIDTGFRILPIFLLSTLSILELSLACAFPIDENYSSGMLRIFRSTFGFGNVIHQSGVKNIAAFMFLAYFINLVLFYISSVKPTSLTLAGSVTAGSIVWILNAYLYFFKK